MTDITNLLFAAQDITYAEFQSRLLPEVQRDNIIGVRTPHLRKLAKQLRNTNDAHLFIKQLPHRLFEENQLHAFIIAEEKNFMTCITMLHNFLPYVDNWATCDQLTPRCFKKHIGDLIPYIRQWITDTHTYTIRFGIRILMNHFLDEEFKTQYLQYVADINSDNYYIHMMQAWFFATALAKQWEATLGYIQQNRLETFTHNKTIQKALESFRITPEHKQLLKTLRR